MVFKCNKIKFITEKICMFRYIEHEVRVNNIVMISIVTMANVVGYKV